MKRENVYLDESTMTRVQKFNRVCFPSFRTHRIHRLWISPSTFGWLLPRESLIFLLTFPSPFTLRLVNLNASGTEISTANATRNSRRRITRDCRCGQSFITLKERMTHGKNRMPKWMNKFDTFGVALQLLSWIGNRSGKNVLPHFAQGINCSYKIIQVLLLLFNYRDNKICVHLYLHLITENHIFYIEID